MLELTVVTADFPFHELDKSTFQYEFWKLARLVKELRSGVRIVLFGRLEVHVLVDRKLRGCTRTVVAGTGSDHTKAAGGGLDFVGIGGTLPGDRNVVGGDQFVEGGVFRFAGVVPALGRGDTDQISLYAGNVDGGLRVVGSGGGRRTLHLLGVNVHANAQNDHNAQKAENAPHRSLRRLNCNAKRGP